MMTGRGFLGMREVLGREIPWVGREPIVVARRPLPGIPAPLRNPNAPARMAGAIISRYPRIALGQAQQGSNAEILRTKGMLLRVRVGSASSIAGQQQSSGTTPQAPEEIVAMIDTGASISAIDVAVAARLGLVQTGSVQVGGVGGMSQQPVFAAALEIPDAGVTFDPLMLSGAQLGAPDFQMLVGRNLLCQMILTYDGANGQFALKHA